MEGDPVESGRDAIRRATTVSREAWRKTIVLSSPAFSPGGPLPREYTACGANVSPPLAWSGLPEGARSLAFVAEDPEGEDGRPVTHWLLYDVRPYVEELGVPLTGLPENIPRGTAAKELPGARQGRNDFGRLGYDGPSPPARGRRVRLFCFRIHALDAPLDLREGATRAELQQALQGKVLASGELLCVCS
ncbi:MAG: YbhB/YbcL family Raf kinase inhibitor-like protein [Planctomycetota bacterium]